MSGQQVLPASAIRGKDWTKMSPDVPGNGPNLAHDGLLSKMRADTQKIQTRCRTPNKGGYERDHMNNLEAMYAAHLEELLRVGEIVFWRFEAMKLVLADRCTYLPDFFLVKADGSPEFHETKGFWRDDARVKVKMAAKMFPCFVFYGVQWDKKRGWILELFSTRAREG